MLSEYVAMILETDGKLSFFNTYSGTVRVFINKYYSC